MLEVNMKDYNSFDETKKELEEIDENKEEAEYNLDTLNRRINKEKSVGRVRTEVYKFIYANPKMDTDVKKKLIEMVDNGGFDGLELSSNILEYLDATLKKIEEEKEEKEEKLNDMKDDFIDRSIDDLKKSNINVNGNKEELKEKLEHYDDLKDLNEEIEKARTIVNENETYEVSVNDLSNAVEKPEAEIITSKVEQQSNNNINNNITIPGNGTLQMNANMSSGGYMAMILKETAGMNLDVYLTKNANSSDCKVTVGNFPIKEDLSNALTQEQVNKIIDVSNNYNPNMDYQRELVGVDATLAKLNELVFSEMRQEGSMKVGINNRNGLYTIGLNLSNEYQPLIDSFTTNGASVSMDEQENSVIKVNGDRIDQYAILNNTLNTISASKSQQMVNTYQYVKKMDPVINNEAANVNHYFLIAIAIMEVLLLGFYFIVLF